METVLVLIAGFLVYNVGFVVYRLYWSPLSAFPGPKLAAATSLYEFYYHCVHRTKFYQQIKDLHRKYGPIIRISPHEVHIDDPAFYHKLNRKGHINKCPIYYNASTHALVTTSDYENHFAWRKGLTAFYSSKEADQWYPEFSDAVERLCGQFSPLNGETFVKANLSTAFRGLAYDVVCRIYLGAVPGTVAKDGSDLSRFFGEFTRILGILRQFVGCQVASAIGGAGTIGFMLLEFLPKVLQEKVVGWAPESGKSIIHLQQKLREIIHTIQGDTPTEWKNATGQTPLLPRIYQSNEVPQETKDMSSLVPDTLGVVIAGTEATANVLVTIIYYLLANPGKLKRLQDELKQAFDKYENIQYGQLKKLEYLDAIIKEGLRMEEGSQYRAPRVCQEPIVFKDWVIPAGVSISVTQKGLHEDPDIFDNPERFLPERWLEADSVRDMSRVRDMKKNLVPFGIGRRSCLGMHFAHRILYITIATIIHRYDFEFSPHLSKAEVLSDGLLDLFPPTSSRGLQVSVKERNR